MNSEGKAGPDFCVKRLSPEQAVQLWRIRAKRAKLSAPRTYNVTNDDLRYQFLQKVLSKELSVKEVPYPRNSNI